MLKNFFWIAELIGIIPIILLLRRKSHKQEILFIAPFVYLMTISIGYEIVATMIFHIDTVIWFRLYLLLEFFAILYFFRKLSGQNYNAYFSISAFIFFAAFIILSIYPDVLSSYKADSYLSVLELLFVYCSSILWFKDLFHKLLEKSLLNSPIFYFIAGFILYFSGTLFLFLISDLIVKSKLNLSNYWNLNIVFSIVLRVLLIIGIWKGQQKSIQYSG